MKKWNVKPGDRVQPGDLLCTVSVGKLNREVTSKLAGTVLELAILPVGFARLALARRKDRQIPPQEGQEPPAPPSAS